MEAKNHSLQEFSKLKNFKSLSTIDFQNNKQKINFIKNFAHKSNFSTPQNLEKNSPYQPLNTKKTLQNEKKIGKILNYSDKSFDDSSIKTLNSFENDAISRIFENFQKKNDKTSNYIKNLKNRDVLSKREKINTPEKIRNFLKNASVDTSNKLQNIINKGKDLRISEKSSEKESNFSGFLITSSGKKKKLFSVEEVYSNSGENSFDDKKLKFFKENSEKKKIKSTKSFLENVKK